MSESRNFIRYVFDAAAALLLLVAIGVFVFYIQGRPIVTEARKGGIDARAHRTFVVTIVPSSEWADTRLANLPQAGDQVLDSDRNDVGTILSWSSDLIVVRGDHKAFTFYGTPLLPGAPTLITTADYALRGTVISVTPSDGASE